MLTKMSEDGLDYDAVLEDAQERGYAERNPAADVEGMHAERLQFCPHLHLANM